MRREFHSTVLPAVTQKFEQKGYDQIWKIIPEQTPRLIKRCPRCEAERFVSSDKFRVNANKKIIDAWLIYKCVGCDYTHKRTLISRKAVSKIDRKLYLELLENHALLAFQCAFNWVFPEHHLSLDWDIPFSVQIREPKLSGQSRFSSQTILIESEGHLKIPLFSILRQQLNVSRSQLEKGQQESKIQLCNIQGETISLKAYLGNGCTLILSNEIAVIPSISLCIDAKE